MTIFSFLSNFVRLLGFAEWADALWRKHEARVAKNVENKDIALPDADVISELHDKYSR